MVFIVDDFIKYGHFYNNNRPLLFFRYDIYLSHIGVNTIIRDNTIISITNISEFTSTEEQTIFYITITYINTIARHCHVPPGLHPVTHICCNTTMPTLH